MQCVPISPTKGSLPRVFAPRKTRRRSQLSPWHDFPIKNILSWYHNTLFTSLCLLWHGHLCFISLILSRWDIFAAIIFFIFAPFIPYVSMYNYTVVTRIRGKRIRKSRIWKFFFLLWEKFSCISYNFFNFKYFYSNFFYI